MKSKQSDAQRQKFIDKAHELEADENEDTFRDRLKRLAKSPPQPAKKDKEEAPE